MRITPHYGYQVLAANLAQSGLTTTDDGVCEFTFTIGGGAHYFTADVVEVPDEVDAVSEKVESGNIELPAGALDSGAAILNVNDIDLDEERITNFEEAAGDYDIKSYLDISLDQVFWRGEANSLWRPNQIHELDDYATITLKLEDGIDGNAIVIVHELHDEAGEPTGEYEIIPVTYDAASQTITFKTKSFSNFAIAAKTTADATGTPDTGFFTSIVNGISSFALPLSIGAAVVVFVGSFIILRRKTR